jgi:hypothetical protein
MKIKGLSIHRGLLVILISYMSILFFCTNAAARDKNQIVRLAKIVVDSTRFETYKAMLKEEIETSVRVKPGVITLYAVSEKDNPIC